MKLVMSVELMTAQIAFPELFLRFVGVAEVLGGLGLVLPGLLRIRPGLTVLAGGALLDPPALAREGSAWLDSFPAAQAAARASGKPIFLVFR